jgi:outer membrane receptor protein involved in Fe transport
MTVSGKTLMGISGSEGFSWSVSYSYMRAEYESDFALVSDANDSRVAVTNSYSGVGENMLENGAASELNDEIRALIAADAGGIYDADFDAWSASVAGATDDDDIDDANDTLADADKAVGMQNSVINVRKGDRMPSIPDHSFKFRLQYNWNAFQIGSNIIAYTDTYMMGNENNEHGNTGGDGKVPGYAIVNLDAKYQYTPQWSVNFKAINVLDKTYYTGGRLLVNGFTGNGSDARSTIFRGEGLAPGSPQAGWITVNYEF